MSTAELTTDVLQLGTHRFTSRLIVGTGKYADYELMGESLDRSGTECITVAVRRERLIDAAGQQPARLHRHQPLHAAAQHGRLLHRRRRGPRRPAGPRDSARPREPRRRLGQARSARRQEDAAARSVATLEATEQLVAEGFQVLCYTTDDPIIARRLKEAGATSVMPAGSPIGSGQGVLNPNNIRICLEYLKEDDPDYPVIVDAGVGTASDVTIAMELGVDGVLLNTGIAHAKDPLRMADAMRHATEAGRLAYLAGRIPEAALRHGQQPGRRRDHARSRGKPLALLAAASYICYA